MNITPNKIAWFVEMNNQILDLASEYYEIHAGHQPDEVSITGIDDKIISCLFIKKGWRDYELDDESGLDIPVEYLWTRDWQQVEQHRRLDENIKAIDARRAREAAEKEKKLEADRKLYEQLKTQFEPEDNISDVLSNIVKNQESLGTAFQKVIDDNYWNLISDNKNDK